MKRLIKAVFGFLALLTAGCDNCKHCSCCHHHETIYKIVPVGNFDKTKVDDCVVLTHYDQKDGFIHACYGSQVASVMKKYFKNEPEAIVLELDSEVLKKNGVELRREANKPGGDIFPHLYGMQKIPFAAIKEVKIFKKDEHGELEESK